MDEQETPVTAEVTRRVTTVTITMTEEHAQTLLEVTDRIGGNPQTSRRGHVDQIATALRKAGVRKLPWIANHDQRRASGEIIFRDGT